MYSYHLATLFLSCTSSNFASKIVKISSEHGWSKQISEIQQTYSIYQFLHSNLNDFLPFYIYKNSTTMKPGHPTFHFGTCYTKLLHRMSFYSSLNSVICHCFQTSRIVSLLKFLFSCNLGAFEHDQVTIPSLPT